MARISYKADQALADKGLLRISDVAKMLRVAPKTVNAWTKYVVTKINGVKYLSWDEIVKAKGKEALMLDLPLNASTSWSQCRGIATVKVTATDTALAKAKALLAKKVVASPVAVDLTVPAEVAEEILTAHIEDPDVLTIPSEYKHLFKGK